MRIKKLRKQQQMSQGQLAEAIGSSQGAVSMWESGKRTPNIYYAYKIASALGVTIEELLYDPRKMK